MALEIIGTSHISADSVSAVTKHIVENKPDIVALELDRARAHSLLHSHRSRISPGMIRSVGVKGFLFLAFASFVQRRLGRFVGVEPGSEMRAALLAAIRGNARVALIDRDLQVTVQRLSKALTLRERFNFVVDLVRSPFSGELKEFRGVDLRRVPSRELVSAVLVKLRERMPSLYRVLVEERNEHMASALARILRDNPGASVFAVVGAGHEDELARLVSDRLKERRI